MNDIAQNKKTILVVDDEKDFTETITTALEHEPFDVLTAHTGSEGLIIAQERHPDLILLDIEMPDMTGLEMLDALRKDEWGQHVKVVMMTVADDFEKIADAVESKIDSYILKSNLKLQELPAIIHDKLS